MMISRLPNLVDRSSKFSSKYHGGDSATTCATACTTSPTDGGISATAVAGRRLAVTHKSLFEKKSGKGWLSFFKTKSRYEYGDQLGEGAFGVVRACKLTARLPAKLADLREDQLDSAQLSWLNELSGAKGKKAGFLFACKEVCFETTEDAIQIDREVQMLDFCRGPRVLMLIEFFESKNTCHIVTNRCYGTIDRRIADDLSPAWIQAQRARTWSAQLLSAVTHVHSKGVIHRDIKPQNVFCTSAGYNSDIVLGDFGLAKKVDKAGTVRAAGSWGYWDAGAFDGRMTYSSDLWAVGITALELCTNTKLHKVSLMMQAELRKQQELLLTATAAEAVAEAKAFFRGELRLGLAGKMLEEGGLHDMAGLRPFLLACLSVDRPASASELLALLPDTEVSGMDCSLASTRAS